MKYKQKTLIIYIKNIYSFLLKSNFENNFYILKYLNLSFSFCDLHAIILSIKAEESIKNNKIIPLSFQMMSIIFLNFQKRTLSKYIVYVKNYINITAKR